MAPTGPSPGDTIVFNSPSSSETSAGVVDTVLKNGDVYVRSIKWPFLVPANRIVRVQYKASSSG